MCHSSIQLPPARNSSRSLCAFRRTVTHRAGGSSKGVTMSKDEIRFWSKVNKRGPVPKHNASLGRCWVWTAVLRGELGYGGFWYKGRMRPAHRVAYRFSGMKVPSNLNLCHKCDNPPCVNPSHLFPGTDLDNMRDAAIKFRMASVLKPDQVRRILWLFSSGAFTHKRLARLFKVGQTTIRQITNAETWRHTMKGWHERKTRN